MSDIAFQFTYFDLALIAAFIGLPGALIGLAVGAFALRGRHVLGALAGALLGDALWAATLLTWA
jgi:hypothetical protein